MSTVLNAVYQVLNEAGEPLHYREITKRIISRQLWKTTGKTPTATINAQLAVSIKTKGDLSPFRRVGKGIYAVSAAANTGLDLGEGNDASSPGTLSFTASAEHILEHEADCQPMHYRTITERALELGLLQTAGQTPEATMYAQIIQEHQRRARRGESQRFERYGKGLVGLTRWSPVGLEKQIQQHNKKVRTQLRERLLAMSPEGFEALVGQLLVAMGFEDVTVTAVAGDGGIDVRGTLIVGDAILTRMAVQAKRWKNNVQAPTVQQVRGSLGAHEQGLIITTSGFSKGARVEALRQDAIPVGLMNGDQLVSQLIEHGIGVHRTPHDLLALDGDFGGGEE